MSTPSRPPSEIAPSGMPDDASALSASAAAPASSGTFPLKDWLIPHAESSEIFKLVKRTAQSNNWNFFHLVNGLKKDVDSDLVPPNYDPSKLRRAIRASTLTWLS